MKGKRFYHITIDLLVFSIIFLLQASQILMAQDNVFPFPSVQVKNGEKIAGKNSVRYLISSSKEEFKPIETSWQKIIEHNANGFIIEVEVPDIPSGKPVLLQDQQKFLKKSYMLEIDSPIIQGLAAKAIEGSSDELFSQALSCRDFVHTYINNIVMPCPLNTALFIATNRTGDCKNFGALLTSLLRANKIPAQAIVGMVFIPEYKNHKNVMMFHLWTEAYIYNTWYPLDATLPNGQSVGPTHIALAFHDLNTFFPIKIVEVMTSISDLKVEVLEP